MELEKTSAVSRSDVSRAVEMIVQGIRQFTSSPLLKYAKTKSMSNRLNNFIIFRDDADGSIQGFLMYRVEKNYSVIYEIHVVEERRSTGIGRRLMEELFKDQSGREVILFVHKRNMRAQKFYKEMGFEMYEEYNGVHYFQMGRQCPRV